MQCNLFCAEQFMQSFGNEQFYKTVKKEKYDDNILKNPQSHNLCVSWRQNVSIRCHLITQLTVVFFGTTIIYYCS